MAEASCWRCTSTDAPPRRSSRAAAAPCAAATVTRASRARSVPSAGRRWSMVVSSGTWLSADTACTARAGREGLVASKERRMAEADTRAVRCRHHRRRDRFRVQAGRLTAAWWCGVRRPCTSVAAMLPVGTRSARDGRRRAAAAHGARRGVLELDRLRRAAASDGSMIVDGAASSSTEHDGHLESTAARRSSVSVWVHMAREEVERGGGGIGGRDGAACSRPSDVAPPSHAAASGGSARGGGWRRRARARRRRGRWVGGRWGVARCWMGGRCVDGSLSSRAACGREHAGGRRRGGWWVR